MDAVALNDGKLLPFLPVPLHVRDALRRKPDVLRVYEHLLEKRNRGDSYTTEVHGVPVTLGRDDAVASIDMVGEALRFNRDKAYRAIKKLETLGFLEYRIVETRKSWKIGVVHFVGLYREEQKKQTPSHPTAVKDSEKSQQVTPYGEKDEQGYPATGEGVFATGNRNRQHLTETKASEGTPQQAIATLSRYESSLSRIQKPLPDMAIDPQAEGSRDPISRGVLSAVGLRPSVSCPTCPESGGCQEPDPSSCSRKSKVAPSVVNPEVKAPPSIECPSFEPGSRMGKRGPVCAHFIDGVHGFGGCRLSTEFMCVHWKSSGVPSAEAPKPPPPNPPMEPSPSPSVSPGNGGLTFDDFLGALRHGDGDPDTLEDWRERSAIREYDGLLSREQAEREALRDVLKHKTPSNMEV